MLKVPAIDIAEVGAGAGSIAHIDDGGLLRVGPESAGAQPGPACYALGGTRPTVTDANVALGFLNPGYLAGGELRLDAALARAAIRTPRRGAARPLGGGGRPRDPGGRQRQHGARDPLGHDRARARSARLHPGRLRGQRPGARGRRGRARSTSAACSSRSRRACSPRSGMLASDVEHHFVRAAGGPLDEGVLEPGERPARRDDRRGARHSRPGGLSARAGAPRRPGRPPLRRPVLRARDPDRGRPDRGGPPAGAAATRSRASTRPRTATPPARRSSWSTSGWWPPGSERAAWIFERSAWRPGRRCRASPPARVLRAARSGAGDAGAGTRVRDRVGPGRAADRRELRLDGGGAARLDRPPRTRWTTC